MLRYLPVDIVCSESKQTVFQVQVNLKLLEICELQGVGNVQRHAGTFKVKWRQPVVFIVPQIIFTTHVSSESWKTLLICSPLLTGAYSLTIYSPCRPVVESKNI